MICYLSHTGMLAYMTTYIYIFYEGNILTVSFLKDSVSEFARNHR